MSHSLISKILSEVKDNGWNGLSNSQGRGLGLQITSNLCKLIGGKLSILQRTTGSGTCVMIALKVEELECSKKGAS